MTRIKPFTVVLSILISTVITGSVLGETGDYEGATENSVSTKNIMQQANETEPQPVTFFMYGSAESGEIKPVFPTNGSGNSAPPARYGGGNLPGGIGWLVGDWSTPPVSTAMKFTATVNGAFWVTGNGQSVTLYVYVYYNGEEIGRDGTETKSVSGDTQFILTTSISEVDISAGETIDIRIYAGSQVGSSFEVAWGSSQYDSHITFTCNPILVSLNDPTISEENVVFSATIQDAFGTTEFVAKIVVNGPADAVTLSDPLFSQGGNGTIVSWTWDYRIDGARDGDYRIKVYISYSEENEFTASGMYMLEFPGSGGGDGGLFGEGGWLMPVIIIVVIAAVIAVAVKIILGKRGEVPAETASIKTKISKPSIAKTSKAVKPAAK